MIKVVSTMPMMIDAHPVAPRGHPAPDFEGMAFSLRAGIKQCQEERNRYAAKYMTYRNRCDHLTRRIVELEEEVRELRRRLVEIEEVEK